VKHGSQEHKQSYKIYIKHVHN